MFSPQTVKPFCYIIKSVRALSLHPDKRGADQVILVRVRLDHNNTDYYKRTSGLSAVFVKLRLYIIYQNKMVDPIGLL